MSAAPAGIALVTGGARRVGAAIVRRLSDLGYACAIHCGTSRGEADALAAGLRAAGRAVAVLQGDLADPGVPEALVREASAALGPLTLLVNNASHFHVDGLDSIDPDAWDRQFAINLRAPAFLSRAFAAQAPDNSSIVNIVDQRVWKLTPEYFSYTLTKAALQTATVTMAQALAPRIRVNAVGPGPTLPNRHDGEEGLRREIAGLPLARGVDPAEIADAVAWLAGAASVTGQMIAVDGGQHIGWRTPDIVTR